MKPYHLFSLAFVLGSLALASPAEARKPDYVERQQMYDRNYDDDRSNDNRDERPQDREADHREQQPKIEPRHDAYSQFDTSRRDNIQGYLRDSYYKRCPPGLRKKHNGCLPPGQAKKRYVIGEALPPSYRPVPEALLVRIGPPPPGTFYAYMDNDVLLVAEATRHILDAVTLLSAMN